MKLKKLLFSSIFFLGLGSIALLNMSSSGGQMGVYATGCSGTGCHGAANTNTSISVTGIPSGGYVAGTVYPITLTVTNADSTLQAGGFDLKFGGGTITGAPANTMLMGLELHHTQPKLLTGSSVSWSFNWTAPSAASTTLNVSANMVNGTGNETGDQWNKVTLTYNQAPSSVDVIRLNKSICYPNPCSDKLTIEVITGIESIQALNYYGQIIPIQWRYANAANSQISVDTKGLSEGNYMILLNHIDGKQETIRISKK